MKVLSKRLLFIGLAVLLLIGISLIQESVRDSKEVQLPMKEAVKQEIDISNMSDEEIDNLLKGGEVNNE